MRITTIAELISIASVCVLLFALYAIDRDGFGSGYAHTTNEAFERLNDIRVTLETERSDLRRELRHMRLLITAAAIAFFIVFVVIEPPQRPPPKAEYDNANVKAEQREAEVK